MADAESQARWIEKARKAGRRRLEIWLSTGAVRQLDRLVKEQRASGRGAVIENLLGETIPTVIREARATVNESARARFDKAVARITAALERDYKTKLAALQASYEKEGRKGIEQRLAIELEKERKWLRDKVEESQKALEHFLVRRDGIKLATSKDNLRLVLNCLHPDRAPTERQERFAKAFGIVKELERYVESNLKWRLK